MMENPLVPIRPGLEESSIDRRQQVARVPRTERPKPKKVATHPVIEKKPSLAKKAASTFLAEDINNVKEFILYDVVIPGIKEAFLSSMEMLLLGSTRRGGYRRDDRRSRNEQVSYDTYYRSSRDDRRNRRRDIDRSSSRDLNSLILRTRGEAEDARDEIVARITEYGDATVADLLQICDRPYEYVDNDWGWVRGQENDIFIKQVAEGYQVIVPKPRQLM